MCSVDDIIRCETLCYKVQSSQSLVLFQLSALECLVVSYGLGCCADSTVRMRCTTRHTHCKLESRVDES